MARSGTSPWMVFAIGCGAAVALGVAVVVGLGFWGFGKAREFERDLSDPSAQRGRLEKVLGITEPPAGYHPMVGISIPFLFDLAILSDRPPDSDGEIEGFDDAGFIFFRMLNLSRQAEQLRDFFEGETDDADVFADANINVDLGERLTRGEVEIGGVRTLFVTHRGEVDLRSSSSSGDDDGLATLVWPECGDDRRLRLGIWFGPGGADLPLNESAQASALGASTADEGVDSSLLAGTVADAVEIERFLSGMELCR